MYIYIYIYTEREKYRERQKDRQKERQTDKSTGRQTYTHIHPQRALHFLSGAYNYGRLTDVSFDILI